MSNPVREFAVAVGNMPAGVRRELRPALRKAAEGVRRDAQSNASWSSRIPAAIKVQTSLSARSGGVTLRVDSSAAPHARPYEGLSGRVFRHPVFGDTDTWVAQHARPFLQPAVDAGRGDVIDAVGKAVDYVAARHGFR